MPKLRSPLLSLFRAQCLESLCHPPVGSLHAKQDPSGLLVWGLGGFFGRFGFFSNRKKPEPCKTPEARSNPTMINKGYSHTIVSLLVLANEQFYEV